MYKKIQVNECICNKCGHKWISPNVPKKCPRCQCSKWNSYTVKKEASK